MKRTAIFIFAVGVILLGAGAPAYAEVVDRIAIVVNGEIITQGEIDRISEPIYDQYKALYKGDELIQKFDEAVKKVTSQLIEDKLILSEAKRLGVVVTDQDIEARLEEIQRRFDTKKKFERALLEQHLSLKDLRARYRDQLMTRKLIDQKVGAKASVSPAEVKEYYEKNIDKFGQAEEVKVRNILIRPSATRKDVEARAIAEGLREKLKGGADFGELAKEFSDGPGAQDGGSMGYIKKGDLLPELEKVVFSLKDGEISDVVKSSIGYHVFRVDEHREARALTLTEVRRDIEEILYREKARDKIKGWVEGLKKTAYIEYK